MDDSRAARLTVFAFLAVVVIAGFNFIAVRFSNMEMPPFWGAALRFGLAAMVLFALVVVLRLPLPRGRALAGALLYGVLAFGGAYALAYWGLVRVSAGLGSVLLASAPLITFLLALVQGQEHFRWRELVGGLIALGGIGVIFLRPAGGEVPIASMLAMVGAAACIAESGIIAKGFPRSHPISTNAVAMAAGAVVLLTAAMVAGEPLTLPGRQATWVAISYLVVLGSSAVFVLYLFVLKRWSASTAAYMFVLIPIVTVIGDFFIEGHPVSPSFGVGGLLVLAGVYVGAVVPHPKDRLHVHVGCEPCLRPAQSVTQEQG